VREEGRSDPIPVREPLPARRTAFKRKPRSRSIPSLLLPSPPRTPRTFSLVPRHPRVPFRVRRSISYGRSNHNNKAESVNAGSSLIVFAGEVFSRDIFVLLSLSLSLFPAVPSVPAGADETSEKKRGRMHRSVSFSG